MGACPVLRSNNEQDLSARLLQLKRTLFSEKSDLTINGTSRWIAQCAGKSQIFKDNNISNIPSNIDTDFFQAKDKNETRQKLHIPLSRKIILCGVANNDPRKGFAHFLDAIKRLHDYRNEVYLVFFGMDQAHLPMQEIADFDFKCFGIVNANTLLIDIYSVADVLVFPSRQENLSNTIMESLSCGVPVVAFDIGGNGDMIDHQSNGYLAKPFDESDMANGIIEILFKQDTAIFSKNARNKVLSHFSNEIVSEQYINLYHSILQSKKTLN